MVFLGVALGLSTAQAAITWDGDFTTFRYDVNKNGGGMLVYPPTGYFSTAQDTELFYYDVSQGRTDPYNSTASGDLTEFGASIPGEIRMTAMAKGPAGGSSPSDGLEVQAFTKVALSELNAHCLDVYQETITWVNRQFSVSSEEQYALEASLSGLVNFAAFGTPPYAATYSLSGEVKLTEIVGTYPNEAFTEVAVLPVSENTRQGSVQITLVNQKGGEPVRYELRAFLTLQTRLINFALPNLTPIGPFPQEIYELGSASAPFVLKVHLLPDSDGDGVPDTEDEFPLDPTEWVDTDKDGTGNNADLDDDNDGLKDADEIIYGTNPLKPDTDNDEMPDGWEIANSLNPLVNDSALDADGDGASNLEEYLAGTDPQDPDSFPFPKKGKGMPWIMLLLDE